MSTPFAKACSFQGSQIDLLNFQVNSVMWNAMYASYCNYPKYQDSFSSTTFILKFEQVYLTTWFKAKLA